MTEEKLKELTTIRERMRDIEAKLSHLNSGAVIIKVERNNRNETIPIKNVVTDEELHTRILNYLKNQYQTELDELKKQFDEA
jgi:CRISPR/Cas system CSM-associated protein Csm5 (group 7 of RAMP superfamily)